LKLPLENRTTLEDTGLSNNLWNRTQIAQQIRPRLKNGTASNKKLLHSKGSSHWNEETGYTVGENLCQLLI
jgi:hypothetical protein